MPEASADPKLVETFSSRRQERRRLSRQFRVRQARPNRATERACRPRAAHGPRGVLYLPTFAYIGRRRVGETRRAWMNHSRRRFSTWRRTTRALRAELTAAGASQRHLSPAARRDCTARTPAGCGRSSRCSAGRASRWSANKAPRPHGASRCIRSASPRSCASAATSSTRASQQRRRAALAIRDHRRSHPRLRRPSAALRHAAAHGTERARAASHSRTKPASIPCACRRDCRRSRRRWRRRVRNRSRRAADQAARDAAELEFRRSRRLDQPKARTLFPRGIRASDAEAAPSSRRHSAASSRCRRRASRARTASR